MPGGRPTTATARVVPVGRAVAGGRRRGELSPLRFDARGPVSARHRAPLRHFYLGISPNLHTACPKWYWHSPKLQVRYPPMDYQSETSSGILLQPVYGPADRACDPPVPGEFPFTGATSRTATAAACGHFASIPVSAPRRNRTGAIATCSTRAAPGFRWRWICPPSAGTTPTIPSTARRSAGSGWRWTPWPTPRSFRRHPLDKISTSFTINGTAAILLAFLRRGRREEGCSAGEADRHHPERHPQGYASRGTWIWPPEPSLRLIADTIEFCAAEVPRFNAISVAGAHFRDAGANAVQEMSFTLADGVTYCDTVVERGRMTIDQFAPQISFFFYTHGDFFEEIAKYRAGRRRWATIVRERLRVRRPTRRRCSGSAACPAARRCTRRRRRTTWSGWPTRRWPRSWAGAVDVHRGVGRAVRAAQ